MNRMAPVLVTLLVACAAGSPGAGGTPPTAETSVVVAIENQNFYDATIYAEYEGFTLDRLGVVSGFQRDTFTIAFRNRPLRMRSLLLSAGVTISNELLVSPGDLVELVIGPTAHIRRTP